MKIPVSKPLFASLALLAVVAPSADAAVVVTFATPSTPGSLVFTNDINFTVTTPGVLKFLVFDEWVTSDGSQSNLGISILAPYSLTYSINNSATMIVGIGSMWDNNATTFGNITPNDGSIFFAGSVFLFTLNDVFTVKAASYPLDLQPPSGFNPMVQQTFTGNAFLADGIGVALSGNSSVNAVPEPSQAILIIGGVVAQAFRRRRRLP
jgi:hypothetical protein